MIGCVARAVRAQLCTADREVSPPPPCWRVKREITVQGPLLPGLDASPEQLAGRGRPQAGRRKEEREGCGEASRCKSGGPGEAGGRGVEWGQTEVVQER